MVFKSNCYIYVEINHKGLREASRGCKGQYNSFHQNFKPIFAPDRRKKYSPPLIFQDSGSPLWKLPEVNIERHFCISSTKKKIQNIKNGNNNFWKKSKNTQKPIYIYCVLIKKIKQKSEISFYIYLGRVETKEP